MQEVTTGMREKGINNMKCIDRMQEVTTGMREKGIKNMECIDRMQEVTTGMREKRINSEMYRQDARSNNWNEREGN